MLVRELPDSGGESFAESFRVARAVVMSFAGARRRGVGRDWRGHRLLRNNARVCKVARTIWSSDRRLPIGAGKTGLDGARNHESAVIGFACDPDNGGRQRTPAANFICETQQCLYGAP